MMNSKLKSLVLLAIVAMFSIVATKPVQAVDNSKITIGITQEFENLNPIISQMSATNYIYYMAGRALVAVDADWKWKCWLCTTLPTLENGLAKITDEKGKKVLRVTWEIHKDAKWGDGKPVTGHDVKKSWEIGKDPVVSTGEKDVYERVEAIDVDKKNPKKFVMTFKEVRYDYYQLGTFYVVPKHLEGPIHDKTMGKAQAYEKLTMYNSDPTNPGLYNGPYVIQEIKLSSHVVLVPNKHWHGKKPAIKRIIVKLLPNTQTLEANLLSGTIDMVSNLGMSFDQTIAFEKRVKQDPKLGKKFDVNFVDGMVYEHIDLNLRNPILGDVKVRKALVHSIDRDKLTNALFSGRQKKAISMIHPRDPYFTTDVVQYDYSMDKAKKLLDEAGWKPGANGIRSKNGKRLSFTLMTTSGNKTRELVQVFLQQEWKKIGIDIQIKNEPARVYFGETVKKALYEAMAMYAWVSSPDNPPRSTVYSKEIPTAQNGYSGQNSGGWRNENVDKILEDIYLEFDLKKRNKMMRDLQWEYTNEVPVIPLYMRAQTSVTPKGMKGYVLTGHQFHSTLNVEDWSL